MLTCAELRHWQLLLQLLLPAAPFQHCCPGSCSCCGCHSCFCCGWSPHCYCWSCLNCDSCPVAGHETCFCSCSCCGAWRGSGCGCGCGGCLCGHVQAHACAADSTVGNVTSGYFHRCTVLSTPDYAPCIQGASTCPSRQQIWAASRRQSEGAQYRHNIDTLNISVTM